MLTSVIVCTYNRADQLDNLLDALKRQTMPLNQFEIIVVVDGSTDHTVDICQRASVSLPNLRTLVLPNNAGLANAANKGIKVANSDSILFTDDDCLPALDWVEKMRSALDCDDIIAGGIDSPTEDYLSLCANISEFHPFMGGSEVRDVSFIAGANMGFKKTVLSSLDGFKSGHPTPDMEFILRARQKGYFIRFHPECRIIHNPRRGRLSAMLTHARNAARQTIHLRNEHDELLHTPFFLRDPFWLTVFTPLIAAGKTLQIYFGNLRMLKYIHTAPVVFLLKWHWCLGAIKGLK